MSRPGKGSAVQQKWPTALLKIDIRVEYCASLSFGILFWGMRRIKSFKIKYVI